MSDRYLHHEGPDGRPGQDWIGGDPIRAWLHAQLGTELRPSAEVQSRAVEREAGYREIQAEQERREKLARLGETFLKSLSMWGELSYRGLISTPDERIRVMGDTIREARTLGLLPAQSAPDRRATSYSGARCKYWSVYRQQWQECLAEEVPARELAAWSHEEREEHARHIEAASGDTDQAKEGGT